MPRNRRAVADPLPTLPPLPAIAPDRPSARGTLRRRPASEHVARSAYPDGRTTSAVIRGATDVFVIERTPCRIHFVKNGVSVQALYMPDRDPTAPDDGAELTRFTALVEDHVAPGL